MRSEGETVYHNDIILLQSRQFQGQHLCVVNSSSSGGLGADITSIDEVFSHSDRKQGWRLQPFSYYSEEAARLVALKGGDMLRLFHREVEGLLLCQVKQSRVGYQGGWLQLLKQLSKYCELYVVWSA